MLTRKTTSWLLILLVIVSAAAWFEHSQLPAGGLGALPPSILPFNPSSTIGLSVKTADSLVVCRRLDDQWKIIQPPQLRADSNRIRFVVETIARAAIHDRVTLRERRNRRLGLDDYGLVIPRAVVVVSEPNGAAELRVGADTPFGSSVFAMLTGSTDIYIVDRAAFDILPKSAEDFRNRTLIPVPADDINGIEIRQPGKTIIRLEKNDGTWSLSGPFPIKASTAAVKAMLGSIENAAIEKFVPSSPGQPPGTGIGIGEETAYGLSSDESPLSASIQYNTGKEQINLTFGKPNPGLPDTVYLFTSFDNGVCTVGKAILDALKMDAEVLREHRIFPLRPTDTLSITMLSSEGAFAISLDQKLSAWTISAPSSQPADPEAVNQFVNALLGLEDANVMPMSDEEILRREQAGLEQIKLTITPVPPVEPISAYVSFICDDAGTATGMEVSMPLQKRRHLVPMDKLPLDFMTQRGFAALRDKTIIALQPDMLSAITKRNGTDEETVMRGRDGQWFSDKPLPRAANKQGIETLLSLFSNLKATRVETLFSADTSSYGLMPARSEFTLATKIPERPVVILMVGTRLEDGSAYVKVKGRDAVFLVPSNVVDILSSSIVIKPAQPEGITK